MKRILSPIVVFSFLLAGFAARAEATFPGDASPIFTAQIRKLIESYAEIKHALIEPDAKAVQLSAQKFVKLATNFDVSQLAPEEKTLYEATVQGISVAAGNISATTDLTVQRENFKEVSNQMVQLLIANRATVADEDGVAQPIATLTVAQLRQPRAHKMHKAVVLLEGGANNVYLRYCPVVEGYYLSEGKDDNPYLSKEKKKKN